MTITLISAIIATVLAALLFTDLIEMWMLYPIALLEGLTAAIGQPARQVMVYDVVEEEDLANAVAINSLGSNTMRIVGPSLAGALIGTVGLEAAFAVQAAAYLLSVAATSRIRTKGEPTIGATTSVLGSMADGIAYARSNRDVWLLVLMAGLPSLLVYPYVQYIPVFADRVLHTGSVGFGFLASAVGYGSIVGAILAANLTNVTKRGQILVWTTFVYMALVTAFALSNIYWLSFSLLVVAGIANSTYLMLNQVMIQLVVDDEYRGRVLSLYVMVSGITPFSALLMGALIDAFGAQVTVACFTGLASAIVLVIGVTSKRLREI
jgi:MFS family permease